MLHLLTITYQRINKEIILRSYDEESRAFFHEFMKNYPGGFFPDRKKSPNETILNILQLLESGAEKFYEVVSISEVTTDTSFDWDVWYRNKT